MKIQGSVVVITGASSGIGYVTARALAESGAKLVLAARSADKLHALARELVAAGREAIAVPTDVTQRSQIDALVAAALMRFGRIDVVVNNAGISAICPIEKTPTEIARAIFELNVFGSLNVVQAVVPVLRRQGGGLVVNISSMVTRVLWPSLGAYAASKQALVSLMDHLRAEAAKDNIRVSTVIPDNTATDFAQHALTIVDPPTEPPEGADWGADAPEEVAAKILLAIETEPRELYVRSYDARKRTQ